MLPNKDTQLNHTCKILLPGKATYIHGFQELGYLWGLASILPTTVTVAKEPDIWDNSHLSLSGSLEKMKIRNGPLSIGSDRGSNQRTSCSGGWKLREEQTTHQNSSASGRETMPGRCHLFTKRLPSWSLVPPGGVAQDSASDTSGFKS